MCARIVVGRVLTAAGGERARGNRRPRPRIDRPIRLFFTLLIAADMRHPSRLADRACCCYCIRVVLMSAAGG